MHRARTSGAIAAFTLALGACVFGLESESQAGRDAARAGAACPRGKVEVVYAGQKTCEQLAASLPAPRRGDQRATMLRTLIAEDWGSPPDLKNRRPPTLRQLLEPFGPVAYAAAVEGVSGIPKTIDRLKPKAVRRLAGLGWALAKAPCSGKGPKLTDSKTKDLGNGASLDLHLGLGDAATAGFGIQGKAKDGSDRTVRWDVDFDLCDSNISLSIPECPTAEGVIDGSGSTKFTVTITTLKGGAVEHTEKIEVTNKVTLKGLVADDAKLDEVKVEDRYTIKKSASRQSIFWGPASEQGTVNRTTRIDMRTGRYDPGHANVVDVRFTYTGILSVFVQNRLAQARISAELAKTSEAMFAQTAANVIREYRQRETAWQTPNKCATLAFSPASRTLRLRNGQRGTFTGKTLAKQSGGVSQGRWRLTGARNARVTPSQARGKALPWAYTVTNADRVVSASFRTTSKAGVAAGTWEQGGGDAPRTWSGTLRGVLRNKNPGGQTTLTSSARVVFELIDPGSYPAATYKVRSGSVQFRLTGTTSEGAVTCRASGQASHTLTKADAYLFLMYGVRGSKLQYHAWGADGNLKQTMTTTWTGHPYCASRITAPVSFQWFSTWDERRRQDTVTSDDLRRLAGTATVVETNITHRWTWDLRAH